MNADAHFFITESIRHSRTLPYPDMMKFLRGLAMSVSEDDSFEPFLSIYRRLNECDHQIELIASGQMKLSLPELAPAKKGPRK